MLNVPMKSLRSSLFRTSRLYQSTSTSAVRRKSTLTASSSSLDLPESFPPQITTLPNGLRVASEDVPSYTQSAALIVDAGPRYESERNSGVSHLLDRLAWNGSARLPPEEMAVQTERLGGNLYNSVTRDVFVYGIPFWPRDLATAISLLSANVDSPLITAEDIASRKDGMEYEIRQAWATNPTLILGELLHSTAWKDNTLGMPMFCPQAQVGVLGEKEIRGFMSDWFRPERMVLAGWGVPHAQLVDLANDYFGGMKSAAANTNTIPSHNHSRDASKIFGGFFGNKTYATISPTPVAADGQIVSDYDWMSGQKARYTGGELYMDKTDEEWVHLQVAFEAPNMHDPDVYATFVLSTLLGGGTSFSSGGPGKGMYSRLQTGVMSRYYGIERAVIVDHWYTDSALLGIWMTAVPKDAKKLANIIANQLHTLTGPMKGGITEEETQRAKNQCASRALRAIEAKMVAAEDLGRQILFDGRKEPVEEVMAKIDAVTREDLWRVATRIFRPSSTTKAMNFGLGSGEPTIVGYGKNVSGLGDVKRELKKWDLAKH